MVRKGLYIRVDQVERLSRMPERESVIMRKALDEYFKRLDDTNVSASLSKKGEHGTN